MEFLNLWKEAQIILTDSGGLQEETTALGIPCLTLRTNTERPITSEEGTNTLVGTDANIIITAAENILNGKGKQGIRPELWDGKAASRTIQTLTKLL
jgi:UDP-N-acetylglucosamine 2-epimerase (non-hydrolysing)